MANRFWVGGAGTWDGSSTANWSATTGGAAGASAPTSGDVAIFDSLSGTGVCSVISGAVCSGFTLNASTMEVNLGANLNASGAFTLGLGTLTLNSNSLICTTVSASGSGVRTINFGTGNINITGNNATVINLATSTNFTYTGTPNINFSYSGSTGTRTLTYGGTGASETNALNLNVTAGTDTVTISNAGQIKSVNFTGFAGTLNNNTRTIYGNLIISSGMTLTAGTSATTLAATSGTQQITTNGKTLDFPLTQNGVGGAVQLQDNLTMGSTRTFTLTNGALDLNNQTLSTGRFSSGNSNVRSIAFGTGDITLTDNSATIWNCGILTNLTLSGTPNVNCVYSGSTGTRTITNTSGALTEPSQVNFYVSAGSDTVTVTSGCKTLDFTGFSGTLNNSARVVYGNLIMSAGMTVNAGTSITTFAGTLGLQQITTNGKTLDFPLTFNSVGGNFAFQDALTQGATHAFTITNGTVQLKNGVTSTVGLFVANNSNVKFLQSTTPGSQATLSQASGTVNVADLTIRDINAVGGAAWNAYTDFENTDAGNNDGWNFSLSPPYSTAELPITLRPFTQPRRF